MKPDERRVEAQYHLWKAIKKFDPTQGIQFSTFATTSIEKKFITARKKVVRQTKGLPINVQDELARIQKTEEQLTEILGQPPTDEQLAEETNLSLELIKNRAKLGIKTVSLSEPAREKGKINGLLDAIAAQDSTVEETSEADALNEMLGKAPLTTLQKTIIKRIYIDGLNQTEVARELDVDRQAVRQAHDRAKLRLAKFLRKTQLDQSTEPLTPSIVTTQRPTAHAAEITPTEAKQPTSLALPVAPIEATDRQAPTEIHAPLEPLNLLQGLKPREKEIAERLARGHSPKSIAKAFNISLATFKDQRSKLLRKLRSQMVRKLEGITPSLEPNDALAWLNAWLEAHGQTHLEAILTHRGIKLTAEEKEVARAALRGVTHKQYAAQQIKSEKTVKTQSASALRKIRKYLKSREVLATPAHSLDQLITYAAVHHAPG